MRILHKGQKPNIFPKSSDQAAHPARSSVRNGLLARPRSMRFHRLPRLPTSLSRLLHSVFTPLIWVGALGLTGNAVAMGLMLERAPLQCDVSDAAPPVLPAAAQQRLPDSQAVAGNKDIRWAWLGSPTSRYPHTALGSSIHAGSLHVLTTNAAGQAQELTYKLPIYRVFEDRVPRLVDLDGDGRVEVVVIESDALRGAALVVFGLRGGNASTDMTLQELARSPHAGSTFRWLNPVGFADFDGDGRLDVASVTTPHIGGGLVLYHYQPPKLTPYAEAMDVSNHRMGSLEQRLAVIVQTPGMRPTVILPDMQHTALHALRWDAPGKWKELNDLKPLPARIERLTPLPEGGGACAQLVDGTAWYVRLMH